MSLALLIGCAGFRSGVRSVAYTGELPPETPATGLSQAEPIRVPGAVLGVELNNTVQQRDLQVVLFLVPVAFDPRDRLLGDSEGGLKLYLSVAPEIQSFVFRPERVRVEVDGVRYPPALAQLRLVGDPDVEETRWVEADPGMDPRGLSYALDVPRRRYSFRLHFDAPIPTPDRDIRVDLREALTSPDAPPLPSIRFRSQPWKEGYT